ncbi:carbamoyltransferase [Rhodocaloribacter litoris]|uniref:carbamoyltransferase family protein n=1 Tax=Rhodocaloribacter litoris TaxID=2558931 RepID=UPI001420A174|nr:carbamoyltransferase [Rhodocaloribacter litoris]QXD14631.1 carbamoyltransferase [Rhodocaloribacter litoris]
MNILGISCWYHDAAACLVQDGRIVAAAQEERFTRRKHDPSFPRHAIAYCLREAGLAARDLDLVAFYDKPFLKFERLLETYVATAPKGLRSFIRAMPLWLKQKLWIPDLIARELDYDGTIVFPEHHESHAASAFYPSPFERAAFLTADGVGEWATTSYGFGEGNRLRILAEIHFPHSLGLLYSAFTYFCGFKVNSGEYKLMGLAPYGEPRYVDVILSELIDLKEDGSFRLNMDYFTYAHGLRMTGRRFARLFGGPRRVPEGPLTRREMDLARSIQVVTEEVMLRLARHVHRATGMKHLCLAGGVALNCVANGRLLRETPFEQLWIQPAAGDAGGALGAALMAWHDYLGRTRIPAVPDAMQGACLGPAFSDADIAAFLEREGVPYEHLASEDDLVRRVAALLAAQKVVGWFQGRMEFGPRALGNRSILADPRGRDMQRRVNLKIKFRESFRPFAPSVLAGRAGTFFDLDVESPYMLLVAPVRGARIEGEGLERLRHIDAPLPAVTHVDGSARIQTVDAATNPRFYRLLEAFAAETGCPVLVNTSFNVRGEPIVCTPEDAYRCFRRTHMDALVLGSYLVTKEMLPGAEATVLTPEAVAAAFEPD